MNDQSKTILWLGLLMIVLQIVRSWKLIASVIFASPSGGSPFNAPLIPPLSGPDLTPPVEEPPVEPPPEIPVVLAAHITPTSRG